MPVLTHSNTHRTITAVCPIGRLVTPRRHRTPTIVTAPRCRALGSLLFPFPHNLFFVFGRMDRTALCIGSTISNITPAVQTLPHDQIGRAVSLPALMVLHTPPKGQHRFVTIDFFAGAMVCPIFVVAFAGTKDGFPSRGVKSLATLKAVFVWDGWRTPLIAFVVSTPVRRPGVPPVVIVPLTPLAHLNVDRSSASVFFTNPYFLYSIAHVSTSRGVGRAGRRSCVVPALTLERNTQ